MFTLQALADSHFVRNPYPALSALSTADHNALGQLVCPSLEELTYPDRILSCLGDEAFIPTCKF